MRRHVALVFFSFLFLALANTAALAQSVANEVRATAVSDGLLLTITLSKPLTAPPSSFALDNPMRIAIDLPDTNASRREAAGAGPATKVRLAQFSPDVARVVADLGAPMELVSAEQVGNNLELRFRPTSRTAFVALVRRGRHRVAGMAVGKAPLPARIAPRPAPKPAVVVIDAGHGGKDPGAANIAGGSEKDVTLAIALATRTAIEQQARSKKLPIKVHLTRADDRFVTLNGRVALARQRGADLFISIHADSASNSEARGASVYTLSDQASDKEAARLAAKENKSDLIAGVDLSGENPEVSTLLIDLSLRDSMNASADFAEQLQRALEPKGVRFRSRFHQYAGFRVLKNLGVPAVLLETGYVSNQEDGAWLKSANGQKAIAAGIADASVGYLMGRH